MGNEISFSSSGLTELIRATIQKGASLRFKAGGFSMCPFIKDGDIVTLSALGNKLPVLGDITAFIHPETNKLVLHRVVGKSRDFLLIKGDASFVCGCDFVSKENILAVVKKAERYKKKISVGFGSEKIIIALLSRLGFFAMLNIPYRIIHSLFKKGIKL